MSEPQSAQEILDGAASKPDAIFAQLAKVELARQRILHKDPFATPDSGHVSISELLDAYRASVIRPYNHRKRNRLYALLVEIAAVAQRVAEDWEEGTNPLKP